MTPRIFLNQKRTICISPFSEIPTHILQWHEDLIFGEPSINIHAYIQGVRKDRTDQISREIHLRSKNKQIRVQCSLKSYM